MGTVVQSIYETVSKQRRSTSIVTTLSPSIALQSSARSDLFLASEDTVSEQSLGMKTYTTGTVTVK
jgi:hypothetical protein